MAPRMVFSGKSGKSRTSRATKGDGGQSDLGEQSVSVVVAGGSEAYPVGCGQVLVKHIPISLLIEDNLCLDYLLCFSRKEFSSEPVELLASHREIERERVRTRAQIRSLCCVVPRLPRPVTRSSPGLAMIAHDCCA